MKSFWAIFALCFILTAPVCTEPAFSGQQVSASTKNKKCHSAFVRSILMVPISIATVFYSLFCIIGMVVTGAFALISAVMTFLVAIFELIMTGFSFSFKATASAWQITSSIFSVTADLYHFYMNYLSWVENFC